MNEAARETPRLPPPFLVKLVLGLRRWLIALADLLVPPQLPLFELATGVSRTQLLGSAARLRIADLLADGPLDAAALAERTGRDPDAMQRMMRALATVGVFCLRKDGRVANNRISAGLRSGRVGTFRDFAEYFGSRASARRSNAGLRASARPRRWT